MADFAVNDSSKVFVQPANTNSQTGNFAPLTQPLKKENNGNLWKNAINEANNRENYYKNVESQLNSKLANVAPDQREKIQSQIEDVKNSIAELENYKIEVRNRLDIK